MSNFGPAPLAVAPGLPICQFVFQRLDGNERYAGLFAGQTHLTF
jgi:dCTP deaminase